MSLHRYRTDIKIPQFKIQIIASYKVYAVQENIKQYHQKRERENKRKKIERKKQKKRRKRNRTRQNKTKQKHKEENVRGRRRRRNEGKNDGNERPSARGDK